MNANQGDLVRARDGKTMKFVENKSRSQKAIEMYLSGAFIGDIAETLEISNSGVSSILRRHEIPMRKKVLRNVPSARERFEANLRITPGCWLWTGVVGNGGYGRMRWNGKLIETHRASYMLHDGEIPTGMYVLHSCDNRLCVNPSHLRLGTHADNMRDMVLRNRCRYQSGQSNPNAKLTEEIVRAIKADQRVQSAISAAYGVSRSHVSYIKTGKLWGHLFERSA